MKSQPSLVRSSRNLNTNAAIDLYQVNLKEQNQTLKKIISKVGHTQNAHATK